MDDIFKKNCVRLTLNNNKHTMKESPQNPPHEKISTTFGRGYLYMYYTQLFIIVCFINTSTPVCYVYMCTDE